MKTKVLFTALRYSLLLLSLSPLTCFGAEEAPLGQEKKNDGLFAADFQNAPTYIKSAEMTLRSEERKVEYRKNVEVLHEDLQLTCDRLEALYTEKNTIDKIYAYDNVFITREEGTQARSEHAVYDQATEIITLTINPEVQENGSVVTADTIRIYLKEDRSEAEGAVRVKLVEQKDEASPKDGTATTTQKDPPQGISKVMQ
jgi:lipopolysaccharide transport protein LptA